MWTCRRGKLRNANYASEGRKLSRKKHDEDILAKVTMWSILLCHEFDDSGKAAASRGDAGCPRHGKPIDVDAVEQKPACRPLRKGVVRSTPPPIGGNPIYDDVLLPVSKYVWDLDSCQTQSSYHTRQQGLRPSAPFATLASSLVLGLVVFAAPFRGQPRGRCATPGGWSDGRPLAPSFGSDRPPSSCLDAKTCWREMRSR